MRRRYEHLNNVPEAILLAYRNSDFYMAVPPGPTGKWTELRWINWVTFSPELERLRAKEIEK